MISPQLIQFYHDQGYLVINNLFTQDDIQHAITAIDQILTSENSEKNYELEPHDSATVRRIWSPTQKHSTFWQMATAPKLLDILENLIGKDILFHYSKLNMKGPKVGSPVEWHQDFSYYPHTNHNLVTALIFLDDASIDNGCLRVIPGSHKKGLLSHHIDGYFRGKVSGVEEESAVNLELSAGDVIFLHCLTLHSSHRNTSQKPRRTFLPAYRAAHAYPIYFGKHAAHNEDGVKLIRGNLSKVAQVENGLYSLPFAEREFGSLYELQEGSHLSKDLHTMQATGYAK